MGIATAAIVVAAAGSAYAANQNAKAAKSQQDAASAAANAFRNVPVPTLDEQKIILQNPQLVGQYTPDQIQAMKLMTTAMSDVHADQDTVDAQKNALQGISEVAKGGFTQGDLAASREAQRQVSSDSEARQKAILNQMASRGTLGSGMELAAQLQGAQQSANQMSSASDNLVQQAQNRALSALSSQGSLAGQMNSQQFGQRSDVARAKDAINQFNVSNSQNVENQNVANSNAAQQYNLNNRQNLEAQRAANANQQEIHNKGLFQTQYANRIGQVGQVNQAEMQAAQQAANAANARAAGAQGMASAVGSGLLSYNAQQNANDQAAQNRQNALDVANANALKQ